MYFARNTNNNDDDVLLGNCSNNSAIDVVAMKLSQIIFVYSITLSQVILEKTMRRKQKKRTRLVVVFLYSTVLLFFSANQLGIKSASQFFVQFVESLQRVFPSTGLNLSGFDRNLSE